MVLHIYRHLKAAFYLYIKKESRHLHAKYNFENLQITRNILALYFLVISQISW